MSSPQQADAIVVGARCAGSATAIALARAGRSVIAIDRAAFPSDTLSTHLLFAGGVAELKALGALERVEALGPPRMPVATVHGAGIDVEGGYSPVDGVDWDSASADRDSMRPWSRRRARRERRSARRTKATGLVREGGRVAGIRAETGGAQIELRAPLVVGADGRSSSLASRLGVTEPLSLEPERPRLRIRLLARRPPGATARRIAVARRRELGTAFPCDDGKLLVLLMPPVERAAALRADPQAEYERTLARIPGLRTRLEGGRQASKVRFGTDLPSYFRRSSGPGWALPGDAGHFKDPVTAQGIRDAMRYGRRLGELTAPVTRRPNRARPRARGVGGGAGARVHRGLPVDQQARPRGVDDPDRGRALPRARFQAAPRP